MKKLVIFISIVLFSANIFAVERNLVSIEKSIIGWWHDTDGSKWWFNNENRCIFELDNTLYGDYQIINADNDVVEMKLTNFGEQPGYFIFKSTMSKNRNKIDCSLRYFYGGREGNASYFTLNYKNGGYENSDFIDFGKIQNDLSKITNDSFKKSNVGKNGDIIFEKFIYEYTLPGPKESNNRIEFEKLILKLENKQIENLINTQINSSDIKTSINELLEMLNGYETSFLKEELYDHFLIENLNCKYNKNSIFAIERYSDFQTGGNMSGSNSSINFNIENGNIIKINDIINTAKSNELIKIISKKIKLENPEFNPKSLSKDNKLKLTENYLFTDNGLLFNYSSWEIFEYDRGPNTEILLTFKELKPFVKKGSILEKLIK
jgi:hypothetical protein